MNHIRFIEITSRIGSKSMRDGETIVSIGRRAVGGDNFLFRCRYPHGPVLRGFRPNG